MRFDIRDHVIFLALACRNRLPFGRNLSDEGVSTACYLRLSGPAINAALFTKPTWIVGKSWNCSSVQVAIVGG